LVEKATITEAAGRPGGAADSSPAAFSLSRSELRRTM